MKYNTIVIDPPWQLDFQKGGWRIDKHKVKNALPYRTMTVDEIKAFPLSDFADIGAHVYCWTTNEMMRKTYEIFDAWGVRFSLIIPMLKNSGICPNMGYVYASEFCLLGFYGKPALKFIGIGKLNWLKSSINKKGEHSKKPREFYRLVETMSPSPYIDIFSRQRRYGWDSWGDQVPEEQPILDTLFHQPTTWQNPGIHYRQTHSLGR